MPRKTSLQLISERPVVDPFATESAAAALEDAALSNMAPPQDVLAELHRRNAQLTQIVTQTAGRAERAEAALHETQTAAATEREQITRAATAQVEKIRADAQQAVKTAIAQAGVAEKAGAAAAQIRQTTSRLADLVTFLVDRAPVLGTLIGAYFLSRAMLPSPSAMQLGLLGIYGAVGVLPAVGWSLRRK